MIEPYKAYPIDSGVRCPYCNSYACTANIWPCGRMQIARDLQREQEIKRIHDGYGKSIC